MKSTLSPKLQLRSILFLRIHFENKSLKLLLNRHIKYKVSCVFVTGLATQKHNRNSWQNLHQYMVRRRGIKMQASYLFAGGMHF